MNATLFKESRRGWTHLLACSRVCVWGQRSLRSRIFGIRVREGFVRRASRAFFGSFASIRVHLRQKENIEQVQWWGSLPYDRPSLCFQVSPRRSKEPHPMHRTGTLNFSIFQGALNSHGSYLLHVNISPRCVPPVPDSRVATRCHRAGYSSLSRLALGYDSL